MPVIHGGRVCIAREIQRKGHLVTEGKAGSSGEKQRLYFVLGTMLLSLACSAVSALFELGPVAAWVSTLVLGLAMGVYAGVTRDVFFSRLLVFGLVVGFGELSSDYFGVVTTGTLVYPRVGPFLLVSPAYMPVAWMIIMVQLGTLADLATQKWGLPWSTLGLMVVGSLNIPLYETLAHRAGFWFYQDTPMLFGTTPWYVILSELLLSAALPLVMKGVSRSGLWGAVLLGVAQAAWVLLTGVLAYALVGK
jgi:hypothetical protein